MRTPLALAVLLLAGPALAQSGPPPCPPSVELIKPFEKACDAAQASSSLRAHWDALVADMTKLTCFERALDKAPGVSACQRIEIKKQIGLAAMRRAVYGPKG